MNQDSSGNEIEKMLDHLSYSNQTDPMAQKMFFSETENIRQNKVNDERVIEALKMIASSNPSANIRKEAVKTLKYLGVIAPSEPLWEDTSRKIRVLMGLFALEFLFTLPYSIFISLSIPNFPVGLYYIVFQREPYPKDFYSLVLGSGWFLYLGIVISILTIKKKVAVRFLLFLLTALLILNAVGCQMINNRPVGF